MKRLLIFLFALAAVTVQAQPISSLPRATNAALGDVLVLNKLSGTTYSPRAIAVSNLWGNVVECISEFDFTNAVKTAPVGSVIVAAPRRWHFLSTDLCFLTNSLTYDFTGSTVVWGSSADAVSKPFFHDIRQATTNYLYGGEHIISNAAATFVKLTNLNSKFVFNPRSVYHTAPSGGGNAIIQHSSGVLAGSIDEFARHNSYDFYWHDGVFAGAKVALLCPRVTVGDTAIEASGAFRFSPGDAYFNFGTVEVDTNGPVGGFFFTFEESCYVRIGTVNVSKQHVIYIGLNNSYTRADEATLEIDHIYGHANDAVSPVQMWKGYARLKNCSITASNGTPAITYLDTGGGLTLDNVKLFTTNATPILSSSQADGVTVESSVVILTNKVDDFIALNGGRVIGQLTNNYAGTNVFFSLNGHEDQWLVVTNAGLIIPTNSTALQSGKTCTLTMIHNGSGGTNDNFYIAAAGTRMMNGGQVASATAPAQFTVTNNRIAKLTIKKQGTNLLMTLDQQQN